MSLLTVPWDTPYTIGFLPRDPSDVDERLLTVAWVNKTGTVALPYRLSSLGVTPGETPDAPPTPPVVNPPTAATPAPGPPGAVGQPAPPATVAGAAPAQVRPAAPPRIRVQSRTNPSLFRRRGMLVRVTVPQTARLRVHVEAKVRRRREGRLRLLTVRLTRQRSLRLARGTTRLRLTPGSGGLKLVGRRTSRQATVVARVRYADGRTATVRRGARIAPPPARR